MIGDETFRRELRTLTIGDLFFDEPAANHTSIGVGGKIDILIFPQGREELIRIVDFLRAHRIPLLPVGNWTNLIVLDGGYRGALISLANLRGLNLLDDGTNGVRLLAEAGCPLSELVNLSVREALTGLEFCAGIPGTVGGAVRMNAGAYGGEIKDIVESVIFLDASGAIRANAARDLHFSYRNLDLPEETIIIGAAFRLKQGDRETIDGAIREIMATRRKKHPLEFRNAGSIFKNPQQSPAGKLVEEAGLKGTRIGDAQVSEKHGNFIINRGKATAGEIILLMALIHQKVLEHSGYDLEAEVKIIGDP